MRSLLIIASSILCISCQKNIDGKKSAEKPKGTKVAQQDKTLTEIEVILENLLIDDKYITMEGPKRLKSRHVPTLDKTLWVKAYKSRVYKAGTYQEQMDYQCHSDVLMAPRSGMIEYNRHRLSLSPGLSEIEFPEGFGYPIGLDNNQVRFNARLKNLTKENPNELLDVRSWLAFYTEKQAKELGLKELNVFTPHVLCAMDTKVKSTISTNCKPVVVQGALNNPEVGRVTSVFFVPPGKHIYKTSYSKNKFPYWAIKKPATVHYIWMHVHPFAESIELRDKTTGKTLFKGNVKMRGGSVPLIDHADHYSSKVGFWVFPDHEYELIGTYNNPTDGDVDAMASLYLFFHEKASN
jgi:hypothetical protein